MYHDVIHMSSALSIASSFHFEDSPSIYTLLEKVKLLACDAPCFATFFINAKQPGHLKLPIIKSHQISRFDRSRMSRQVCIASGFSGNSRGYVHNNSGQSR